MIFNLRGSFQPNWTNLKLWLCRVHLYRSNLLPVICSDDPSRDMIFRFDTLFTIVDELRDVPWERVERVVKELHKWMVKSDPRWA